MSEKVKDPVCGMTIDTINAKGPVEIHGNKFYFCSSACMDKLKKEPQKYIQGRKHGLRIVIGSALPLLAILLFPVLGLRTTFALFIWMVIMFGCYWGMTSLPESDDNYFKNKKYGCH